MSLRYVVQASGGIYCDNIDGTRSSSCRINPGQAAADWMQSYGERDKECLEWTDTCVNCVRAQSGDNFNCSNIGIACQPKEVTCVRRAEEKVK